MLLERLTLSSTLLLVWCVLQTAVNATRGADQTINISPTRLPRGVVEVHGISARGVIVERKAGMWMLAQGETYLIIC